MELQQKVSRLGMFTASSIWQLMQSGKGKNQLFGKQAMTYINEKIAEIITGECKQQAKSASLDWGNEHEKDAYLWLNTTHPHEYLGRENFKFFELNQYAGGSPDGISEDCIFEYKCPYNSSNHVAWLINGSKEWLEKEHYEYYVQLQFNMLCTGKENGLIASYDPRTVDAKHRMAIIEIERDNEMLADLVTRISEAVKIISSSLASLT